MGRTRKWRETSPRPTRPGNGAAKQPLPQPSNSPANARGKGPAAEAPRSARKLGAHRPSAHTQAPSPATRASRGGAALRPTGLGAHRPSKQQSGPPGKGSQMPPALAAKRGPSAEGAARPPRSLQQRATLGAAGAEGPGRNDPCPGGAALRPRARRAQTLRTRTGTHPCRGSAALRPRGLGAHRPSSDGQGRVGARPHQGGAALRQTARRALTLQPKQAAGETAQPPRPCQQNTPQPRKLSHRHRRPGRWAPPGRAATRRWGPWAGARAR